MIKTLHTTTIVMVEDDEGHSRLIIKNLARAGISSDTILHFSDGIEAMEYLSSKEPHSGSMPLLILLDLNLPGIDGYEILRQVKDNPRTRNIPVIMLTTTDKGLIGNLRLLSLGISVRNFKTHNAV